ncbi:MAG: Gfo/Idh/MocA family oxidoreductase [Pseudomonadota bacterium]
MSNIRHGASYAPKTSPKHVVQPNDFRFAAAFLDHGHIYGQTNGLLDAGGTLTAVYDPDPERAAVFAKAFRVNAVESFDVLLDDTSLHLITSAAIPNERAGIGRQVLESGKDYFTDKSPFTTLAQLEEIKQVVAATGRKYFVYYAERVHNEAAWRTGELIEQGAIGKVIQVLNLAPHRLSKSSRPDWFFKKARYGGIITDIGSHQVEQFLTYADCSDADVNFARVHNFNHPDVPELEDFGELSLTGDNDASFYSRIDWYTPEGMPVWGDGRTFVLGTEGSIEARKYIDLGREVPAALILHVDGQDVETIDCKKQVGFPFFGQMILDVLNRTENSMTQAHAFKAAELSMQAQAFADGKQRT